MTSRATEDTGEESSEPSDMSGHTLEMIPAGEQCVEKRTYKQRHKDE